MKKTIKLYNLIFPVYLLFFLSPLIFVSLIGNYIIDAIIILIVLYSNDVVRVIPRKLIYITKVWVFGFLADIIAAFLMFFLDWVGIIYSYNPLESIFNFILMFFVIVIGGLLVGYFNYRLALRNGLDKKIALRQAVYMGVFTAPWLFFLPISFFGVIL